MRKTAPKARRKIKTAPLAGAVESLLLRAPLSGDRGELLLFLRSSLLLRGLCSFLGCVLHRLILPNIKICDLKKIAV